MRSPARGALAPAPRDSAQTLLRSTRSLDAVPVRLRVDWDAIPVNQLDTRDFDGRGRPLPRWTVSEPEGGAA